ncbi:MAG: efflux RND transporter periplasmic adaptor subunit [Planctomycetota bacterium]|jgi:multidrug efflux pump subunit AcrA (membrane-fusion protein)
MMRNLIVCALACALSACGDRSKPTPPDHPRPVKVMEVEEMSPLRPVQVSGSVTPWREEDISFEVSGRIEMIVDRQTNLSGRWKVGSTVREKGDVLAKIDTEPYEIARDNSKAQIVVGERDLVAARVELEKVLPAQKKVANVQIRRAEAEYKRKEQAYKDNAVSEIELIRAEADRDTRLADLEQVEANIEQQKANIESIKAQIQKAKQDLRQAEYDLERCTLIAPFDGEVSDLYTVAGGYARAGEPVAHLIMMDPIKVDVAVSPETARSLGIGDSVQLLLPGETDPTSAMVFEIATAADAMTRTFRVSLFARNGRRVPGLTDDDPRRKATRIERFMYVSREEFGSGRGPFYVEENRALRKDAEGYFVWNITGKSYGDPIQTGSMLPVRKVRVKPGDQYVQRQGIFVFRSLEDTGGLKAGAMVALDVPEGFEGSEVLLAQQKWRLQPGQVVSAVLAAEVPERGIYAPMSSIAARTQDAGAVFVVSEGVARRVAVKVHGNVGAYFHVEPADADGKKLLAPGAQVILDYVHFLRDREPVKVTQTVKANP